MNKIYKLVYSTVRGCYVVASEFAKARGKSKSLVVGTIAAGSVALQLGLGGVALAQNVTTDTAATNKNNAAASQAVNIENKKDTTAQGSDAYVTYDSEGNLIAGKDNEVVKIQKDDKAGYTRVENQPENVVIGTRNGVGTFTHSTDTKKPVDGNTSYSYEDIDTKWITTKVYNPETKQYEDKQIQVYSLVPGQYMDDAHNVRAKYPDPAYYSSNEDYNKAVDVYNSVATYIGTDSTSKSYYVSGATAVGIDNIAEGTHSTAIGNKAKVLNATASYYVDAYGKLTSEKENARYWLDENGNITTSRSGYTASDGTFVDRYLMVPRLMDSSNAVALGSDVLAVGRSAVAVGHDTHAKEFSVAIGKADNTDYSAVAVGNTNRAQYHSVAVGNKNAADGYYALAQGEGNTVNGDYSNAVGYQNQVSGSKDTSGSERKAQQSQAYGDSNTVKGNYSMAYGNSNTVTGDYAVTLGNQNKIGGGNTTGADGERAIAVGYNNQAEEDTVVIGQSSQAHHSGSIAIGKNVNANLNNNNNATDSIAIGTDSKAVTKDSIAFGHGAAIGNNMDVATSGSGSSVAMGTSTFASAAYDVAIGGQAMTASSTSSNSGGSAVAIGYKATVNDGGQRSMALGANASVERNLHDAVALGSQSRVTRDRNTSGGYNAAAGGSDSYTDGTSTWNSTLAAVSVGTDSYWDNDQRKNIEKQTRQITNVAAGKQDTDAVNVAQLKKVASLINNQGGGTGGSNIHDYSVNSVNPNTDTNHNNTGATGSNALAAGVSASATGENAVAIGTGAKAEGKGATVIGQYASATGDYATAFGGEQTDTTSIARNNLASGKNAVAFGERTTASGANATAFGLETTASEKRATAFGQRTTAKQSNATAFGQDTLADGQNATAFGNLTVASNYGATAFGNKNKATGQYATAWGGGDKVIGKDANGKDIKQGTVASGTYATAFGERTEASGESATAFGSDSTASGKDSLAFGTGSTASGDNSMAGLGGTASTANSIALGKDTKANNAQQAVSVAIGENAEASGARSLAIGFGVKGKVTEDGVEKDDTTLTQTTASGESAVSIGTDTQAVGQHSIAMGSHTEATKDSSLAIGYDTHATEASAVAIGSGTKVNRGYGVAIGLSALAGIDESDPASQGATTYDGSQTVAVGYYARATATNAAALGAAASANVNGAVALGYQSATTREAGNRENGTVKDAYLKPATVDKASTWTSTAGAVSIGNANRAQTRQLTNLAAGSDDTDAVNVAQLKQVKKALDDAHLDFAGDKGTSSVKLNRKVTVSGGETDPDKLVSDNNIGVVASQDGANSKLELKLAKDIKGLNSVTAGNARLGHNEAGTLETKKNGSKTGSYAEDGNYVTGLDNRKWDVTEPEYVSGRGATEDELAVVSGQVTTNKTDIANNKTQIEQNTRTIAKGLRFTTNRKDASNTSDDYRGYKVVQRQLGDTIAIKGSDAADGHTYSTKNLTTEIAENGDITVKMDEKPDFTTVSTNDVIYKGRDSDKAADNKAASADLITYYGDKTLVDGKNVAYGDGDTKTTRLSYTDAQNQKHDVATLDDGQIYAGDFNSDGSKDTTGFVRTLNQKTTINGGAKKEEDLTDGNIGVVSNGKDTLTVKLNKDLQGLNSVTTGDTVINNNGLTINNAGKAGDTTVTINKTTISYGGNQVNNMGSGSDGVDKDGKPTYTTITNGANIGDVQNIANTTVQPVIDTVNAGWELDYNSTKLKDVTPTSRRANFAAGQNIALTGSGDTITVATAEDVRFNTVRVGGDKTDAGYTGGIVIGKQTGGGANTDVNSYITGLKNTSWDNTKIQSGRAATEDQLKQVAEEIKGGVVASDVYVSGGGVSYSDDDPKTKNDGKGKLTLTRNNAEALKINGLHDYYITNGSVSTDGKTLTLTRNDLDENGQNKTISVDLGGILKNDLRLVQNPAAGSNGKYTVSQDGTVTLKVQNADGTVSNDITIGGFEGVVDHYKGLNFDANTRKTADGNVHNVKMGDTIKVQGTDPVTGHTYSADNVTTEVDDSGNITIKLDQDLKAQTVTVSGKDGKDGRIGLTGKDGQDGTVTTIIRTIGKNGTDGTNGTPGVDGKNGITRIVYQDGQDGADGTTTHTVATLDDGLKFSGDDGLTDSTKVIAKKLNEQLDITGGAKGALTDNNIGVTNKEGQLYVQLAQNINLGDNGSLQAGNATIGAFSNTALTTNKGNHPDGGSYATGLSNRDWNVKDPEFVSGRAATEDQLQIISKAINDNKTVRTDYQLIANPNNTTDGSYTPDNGTLELTVRDTEHQNDPNYKDKTITIKDIASKSKVDEALDRTVKYDMGSDNKVDKTHITLEGGDAGTQIRNMASGASEITTDAQGNKKYTYNTDTNAANIGDVKQIADARKTTVKSSDGTVTVVDKNANDPNATSHDYDLSVDYSKAAGAVDLKYTGDNGTSGQNKLSEAVAFNGTANQIVTTAANGSVTFKLADDLKTQTVTVTGKDGKDGQIGITGKNGDDGTVTTIIKTIGKNGTDGTNGTPGVNGTDGITRIVYQDGKDGEAGTTTHTVATLDDGLKFGANAAVENGTNPVGNKLNSTIDIVGTKAKDGHTYSADNLTTTVAQNENGKTTITVLMDNAISADSVKVGKDGKDGTNGVDGRLIIKNGKDGKDGADAGIHVIKGEPGVNGKDGETITRVVYNDGKDGKDGKDYTLATTEDGMKFKGDDDKVIAKKLNEQLEIIGGAKGDLTDKNIAVKSTTDGKLKVQLAKDLTDLNSVTAGDTVMDSNGLTINKAGKAGDKTITISKTTVSYGGNQVNNMGSGINSTTNAYDVDTNGANIGDVKHIADARKTTVKSSDGTVTVVDKNANDPNATSHDYDLSVDYSKAAGAVDLKYTGDNNTSGQNKLSEAVAFNGTANQIVTTAANGSVTFKLADDLKTQTVTVTGKDGKDGRIGLTGKDGKDGTVTTTIRTIGKNGTDGTNGTPGVNGKDGITRIVYNDGKDGKDHTVATLDDGMKYAGNFGQGAAVKLNKTVTIKGELAKDAKETDFVDNNIAVVANQKDDNGELLIKLNKNLTGLNSSTYTSTVTGGTSTTVVDGSGLKIKNGPSITNTGIDAGSQVISHVADGKEATDAVNVSQLTKVEQEATAHSSVEAGPSGNVTVTPGTNSNGGTKYTVDLNNNVNFGQDDKQIAINGDNGTVTIGQGDKQVKLDSKDGSITAGGVTINKDGKGTVNGLTNTEWDGEHITSGQAATEDQLQKVEHNVNTKIDNVNNKVDKVAKQHTTVSVNGGNAQGNLVMERTNATDEKGANYDISLSNDVTIGTQGEDGKDGKLTVTSKDGTKAITADGQNGTLTFKDGNSETAIKAAEAAKGVDGTKDIKRVAVDNHTVATLDDGMQFAGDSGEALKQKLNSTTNIKGGATGELTDGNIGVVSDGRDTLTVKLAKDIKGLDSVEAKTVNATTVNSSSFNIAGDGSHNAITIKQGDVNMGGNTISGVAPGKVSADSTEAVNGSQLYARDQAIGKLGNSVNRLDNKINRAGAGAAALAALHPQDFDPDDKWDFAAGYGNYHGASAAAIGAFYRPTEDVMVSVGGSMGGGENMVNAGVTFKLGQHNHVSNSRVAMAKEIKALRQHMAQQDALIAQLQQRNGMAVDPARSGLFPDVAENHWAYEYVTKLARQGILEGYPDGEFKGDRMMTRYEFAAIVYRLVQSGAASTDPELSQLVKEFSPELQYIRIDAIEKDRNGKPTIERVRVIKQK